MESFTQKVTPILDRVRALTPGSRLAAAGLLLAMVVGLGGLCFHSFSSSTEPLLTGQSPSAEQLGRIQTALAEAGLSYDIQGSCIMVPRGRRSDYLAAIGKAGAWSDRAADPVDAAIAQIGLTTPFDKCDTIMNRAEEERVEAEIAGFADVAEAKVHLRSREDRRGGLRRTTRMAAVNLRMKNGERLTPKLALLIRDHLVHGVGLEPENVIIADRDHLLSYQGNRIDENAVQDEEHQAACRLAERECQEKIAQLLHFIPGATVMATMQVVRSDESRDDASAAKANQPWQLMSDDSADERKDKPEQASREALSVVVHVPESYLRKISREQADQFDAASSAFDPHAVERCEIDRIKRLAAGVMPVVEGIADPIDRITVVSFADSSVLSAPLAETSRGASWAVSRGVATWLVAIGGVVFLVFRFAKRRTAPAAESPRETPAAEHTILQAVIPAKPRGDAAGIDLSGPWARRLIQRRAASARPESRPFDALRGADCLRITRVLAGESAQTIALVLSHLEPGQSGRVLACLAPGLQADVLHRLVDLEQTDGEVLREIERSLELRLAEQVSMHPRREAGLDAVGRILDASRQGVRRQILSNLSMRDKALAARLASREEENEPVASLADLTRLDAASMAALHAAAGDELLTLALVGAADELVESLLNLLPEGLAVQLRTSLEHFAPTRLSDVDDARRRLFEIASSLAAASTRPVGLSVSG